MRWSRCARPLVGWRRLLPRRRGAPARGAVARRRAAHGAQAPAGSARRRTSIPSPPRRASTSAVPDCCRRSTPSQPTRGRRQLRCLAPSTSRLADPPVHLRSIRINYFPQHRQRQPAHLGLRGDLRSATPPRRPRTPRRRGEGVGAGDRSEPAKRVLHRPRRARRSRRGARETLANQNKHLEQIQSFVDLGRNPTSISLQARVDQANAEVQLINAENDYASGGAAQPGDGRGGRHRLRRRATVSAPIPANRRRRRRWSTRR